MTEGRISARQHIRERARLSSSALLEETPAEARMSVEEAQRRNQLEFARSFDPNASLSEEVLLRLVGEGAHTGTLPADWSGVVPRFQSALDEFWPSPTPLELEVTGFSAGSTVVHFSVASADEAVHDAAGAVTVDQTSLADAAERLAKVLDKAASGGDLKPWTAHLHAVERLAGELQKHALTADMTYLGRAGRVLRASLNKAVLERLETLSQTHERVAARTVQGRITQLAENGMVKVKSGEPQNSPAHLVHLADGQKLRKLIIGQQVHWLVQATTTLDGLDRAKDETLEYLGEAPDTPPAGETEPVDGL